eukprot:Transcript_10709.p2 GENE.Transcript_10709~~Transcript_10709.p2  ORF type:complete len:489 (-),score=208.95 Transcript_10709:78-1499(-)
MSWLLLPLSPLLALTLALALLRLRVRASPRRPTLAFLHPYCNDGGGGERVLWVAIRELVERGIAHPDRWRVIVYTGDAIPPAEIRANALRRFGVELPAGVEFVYLGCRGWIEPRRYPVATLIGQALGSMVLAAEALLRAPPDVLVDTTGLAYCFPVVRAAGVRHLGCYVHYPIVQSDMLGAVASRQAAHNNAAFFARSAVRSAVKLAYYRALLALYSLAGSLAHTVMANGSWTAAHLRALWRGLPVAVVFPPCDTAALQALPLLPRTPGLVLSVAQFRPEKDHALQLQAFALLLTRWRAEGARAPRPKLVVAGAVRHAADQARLDALRAQAEALGLADGSVEFAPNLSLAELRALLGQACVGLHTMWNEHFGIGVVEMMAAGVAPIAHDSGGPALDIVGRPEEAEGTAKAAETGLLATSAQQYADAMAALLLAPKAEQRRKAMAAAARASVQQRFSEAAFSDAFCASLAPALG